MHKTILLLVLLTCTSSTINSNSWWGFFGHKRINRLAVFILPEEMIPFYKKHIVYLTENAINPDRRRYAVEGEAPKHYIDLDVYGDSALHIIPHKWSDAIDKYTEDTLQAYGIVPWNINFVKYQLTKAFENGDINRILRLSADLGHYIADANVPLHTTENYNGQMTGQYGIHGFWESRLPELFSDDYDYLVGKAEYIEDPQEKAWEAVTAAHMALDSVLSFEKKLTKKYPKSKKYSFEERGAITTKVYSRKFSNLFHNMLNGQVERRMLASIKMVGNFWYTCWVDAGQPDMNKLLLQELTESQKKRLEEDIKKWNQRGVESRNHN